MSAKIFLLASLDKSLNTHWLKSSTFSSLISAIHNKVLSTTIEVIVASKLGYGSCPHRAHRLIVHTLIKVTQMCISLLAFFSGIMEKIFYSLLLPDSPSSIHVTITLVSLFFLLPPSHPHIHIHLYSLHIVSQFPAPSHPTASAVHTLWFPVVVGLS